MKSLELSRLATAMQKSMIFILLSLPTNLILLFYANGFNHEALKYCICAHDACSVINFNSKSVTGPKKGKSGQKSVSGVNIV